MQVSGPERSLPVGIIFFSKQYKLLPFFEDENNYGQHRKGWWGWLK
jgi:hypothetical protein